MHSNVKLLAVIFSICVYVFWSVGYPKYITSLIIVKFGHGDHLPNMLRIYEFSKKNILLITRIFRWSSFIPLLLKIISCWQWWFHGFNALQKKKCVFPCRRVCSGQWTCWFLVNIQWHSCKFYVIRHQNIIGLNLSWQWVYWQRFLTKHSICNEM